MVQMLAAADNNGNTALMYAAFGGCEVVTKVLLDHGADVTAADINGKTALWAAAKGGHETVKKLLLDHGADVAAADDDRVTALTASLLKVAMRKWQRYCWTMGQIVTAAVNHGQTSLVCSAKGGHEAVTELLDRGANVAAAGIIGVTALMAADEAVTKLLLDRSISMETQR